MPEVIHDSPYPGLAERVTDLERRVAVAEISLNENHETKTLVAVLVERIENLTKIIDQQDGAIRAQSKTITLLVRVTIGAGGMIGAFALLIAAIFDKI